MAMRFRVELVVGCVGGSNFVGCVYGWSVGLVIRLPFSALDNGNVEGYYRVVGERLLLAIWV